MSENFVTALNTVSGVVGQVPVEYLTHPHFKNQLVLVEEGTKSYAPELYQPRTVEEYLTSRPVQDEDEDTDDEFTDDENEEVDA